MLRQYSREGTTVQEREIMRQLFESCESHRPKVFKLAAEIAESNEEIEEGPNLGKHLKCVLEYCFYFFASLQLTYW